MNVIKEDLSRLTDKKVTIFTIIKYYFIHMGFKAVVLYRLMDFFSNRNKFFIAKLIRNHNLKITGAEFCICCKIGPGLLIHHPNGIVIGSGTIIGNNATILQQVTCGESYKNNIHEYPKIGDNVVIGAGAKILGGIFIGNRCIIGANAVVTKDFPNKATIVGVPARTDSSKK